MSKMLFNFIACLFHLIFVERIFQLTPILHSKITIVTIFFYSLRETEARAKTMENVSVCLRKEKV